MNINLETVLRSLFCVCVTVACRDSEGSLRKDPDAHSYIRYVNAVYQEHPPGSSVIETNTSEAGVTTTVIRTPVTYTSVPIDILIDSAPHLPSVTALAPNSISTGESGPAPQFSKTSLYRKVPRGVRSFVARRSGLESVPGFSFFTTSAGTQYLPRIYMVGKTPYTLIVAGINVADSDSGQVLNSASSIPFSLVVDDPFYAPTVLVNDKPTVQARFRVYSGATFGNEQGGPTSVNVYLVPGHAAPDSLKGLKPLGQWSDFRDGGHYINVTPGEYYLILARGATDPLWGKPVVFKEGEVRSFFLLNDMDTYTVTNVQTIVTQPSGSSRITNTKISPTPTFKVIETLDNQW